MLHFGPAHTTGDTAVLFREANLVHMGDVFIASYPFTDAGNGGDINYIDMLETVASRISAMIDSGMSLEEVVAANPTVGFDEQYGDPARLINRAYTSLSS